eukprot:TRINITY_DN564378_c0_g1_i3.p1 TRINITY_DN564378_c0_g1~~TRINITY_DN564378_c0_g1_i3.p1  ORF type:complete len:974 (-),score=259.52 TRINITY_DN564378_c0_g1_i3:899-3820(-)
MIIINPSEIAKKTSNGSPIEHHYSFTNYEAEPTIRNVTDPLDPTSFEIFEDYPIKNLTRIVTNSYGGAISLKNEHGAGVYFTQLCTEFENGPECLDAAYSYRYCGVGLGSNCDPCPKFTICPGGLRKWPVPGYWAASEIGEDPVECQTPKTERCQGWDVESSSPVCGERFAGPECGSCATGFYPGLNNLDCLVCPKTTWISLVTPFLFVGFMGLLLFLFMFGLVYYATRTRGGSLIGGVKRTGQFVIWTIMTVQTIIQVGKSAKSNLPPQLQFIYEAFNIFQFEMNFVHPNCMGDDPHFADKGFFLLFTVVMGGIIAVGFLLHWKFPKIHMITDSAKIPKLANKLASHQGKLLLLMGLMYPLVCNEVSKFTDCTEINGILYLRSNTVYKCYTGELLPLNMLAWIHMIVTLIGFPLFTWYWIQTRHIKLFLKRYRLNSKLLGTNGGKALSVFSNPMQSKLNDPAVTGGTANKQPSGSTPVQTSRKTFRNRDLEVKQKSGKIVKDLAMTPKDKVNQLLDNTTTNSMIVTSWRYFLSGDYLATRFWFRQAGFIVLFLLTLSMSYDMNPMITTAANCVVLGVFIYCFAKWAPYIEIESWKRPVKTGTLLLSIFASLLNTLIYLDAEEGMSVLNGLVTPLCYVMTLLSVLLIITLIVSFIRVLFTGAKSENEEAMKKKRRRRDPNYNPFNDSSNDGASAMVNPMMMEFSPNALMSHKPHHAANALTQSIKSSSRKQFSPPASPITPASRETASMRKRRESLSLAENTIVNSNNAVHHHHQQPNAISVNDSNRSMSFTEDALVASIDDNSDIMNQQTHVVPPQTGLDMLSDKKQEIEYDDMQENPHQQYQTQQHMHTAEKTEVKVTKRVSSAMSMSMRPVRTGGDYLAVGNDRVHLKAYAESLNKVHESGTTAGVNASMNLKRRRMSRSAGLVMDVSRIKTNRVKTLATSFDRLATRKKSSGGSAMVLPTNRKKRKNDN